LLLSPTTPEIFFPFVSSATLFPVFLP